MRLKAVLIALAVALGASSGAQAQCTGNPASGLLCGNGAASAGLPAWVTVPAILERGAGATPGTVLNRGASVWSATATPQLGNNGGTGGSIVFKGATSGAVTLGVPAAAGTTTFNLPNTNGSVGQVLITDGSGNASWAAAGSGTVTSVGLSMPGIFSVSGSPVTGAGTLTATLANQSANQVWAGPSTGAAAAPAFRSLVGADLPNPSASTLGGVQSYAAVSSQWIRQISTSGVVTSSQPAFSDISGTLDPTQCPNPSASTIGCVQSFALQASKWISSISTSGVPSATQPNFTDIAGAATLAQLPSIGNNTVLGNNSGGTAIPGALSASNVIDMIGSTRGQVLYRGASGWSVLAPGTAGFVLQTGGAGADPSWIAVAGTGTVTSIAAGTGIAASPSPITATGTISLASIADLRVLANVSGGSAAPIANTMTAILDATLGSTQGNILYRDASNWTVLAPGTNGQVLTQGASTPAWGNAGTVSNVTISAGTGIGTSGTCTITTTGTCTVALSSARQTNPTTQSFTSGSGTYTRPSNVLWIEVWMVGGGGGGGGSGSTSGAAATAGGDTCWNTSGAACTTPVSKAAGGGASTSQFNPGSGGAGSGTCNVLSQSGGSGQPGIGLNSVPGGAGGTSMLGGVGWPGTQGGSAGSPAQTNSGSGGGGGGAYTTSTVSGGGGGAGATCAFIINAPAASYTYAVGSGGSGQGAGTGGYAGGAGAAGRIWVIEHYN